MCFMWSIDSIIDLIQKDSLHLDISNIIWSNFRLSPKTGQHIIPYRNAENITFFYILPAAGFLHRWAGVEYHLGHGLSSGTIASVMETPWCLKAWMGSWGWRKILFLLSMAVVTSSPTWPSWRMHYSETGFPKSHISRESEVKLHGKIGSHFPDPSWSPSPLRSASQGGSGWS